jgi:polysaccharide biosynthesis protein PslH
MFGGSSCMGQVTVLFLTPMLPASLRGGGHIVTDSFVENLRALGASVTLLGYQTDTGAVRSGEISAGKRIAETARAPVRAALWGAAALASGNPYSMQKWKGGAYRAAVRQLIRRHSWDIIVIEHSQMAWVLKHLEGRPFVFLAHNAEAPLYRELAEAQTGLRESLYRRESRLIGQVELELAQEAAEVWTLTHEDAAYFGSIGAKRTRVFQVPGRVLNREIGGPTRGCVALLGSWTWQPNRAGLEWYMERVHPQLADHVAVEVGGLGANDIRSRYRNLRYCGFVEDSETFLATASCIAVPSTQGGGIQVKTLDAIATGRPVVTTQVGIRGIEMPPDCVRVAGTEAEFAQMLQGAILDPAEYDPSGPVWAMRRRACFQAELKIAVHERSAV